MDDEVRQKLLGKEIGEAQMAQIAEVCNRYPNVEMDFTPTHKGGYKDGDNLELVVVIKRPDVEDHEELAVFNMPVKAQYFPGEKDEQWWVLVGRPKLNKLYSIKKITTFKGQA